MPARKNKSSINVFNDPTVTPPMATATPSRVLRSSKRKRLEEALPATAPKLKLSRSALGSKSANSTQNSVHPDDFKKEEALAGENPLGQTSDPEQIPESDNNVFAIFMTPGPICDSFTKKLDAQHLHAFFKLVKCGVGQAERIARVVTKFDCWTPEILRVFGTTDITSIDLSSPSLPPGEYSFHEFTSTELLEPFFQQGRFQKLTTLTLRNRLMIDDNVALLRLLPSLQDLDLTATTIGEQALHHLVCHRHNLRSLNISTNERIGDDARIMIRAFCKLEKLFLRGTGFTLPGLRRLLADEFPRTCRLLSLPIPVLEAFNTRLERYSLEIPSGYISEPDLQKISGMTQVNLNRNLKLHQEVNKDIQVSGTKSEQVHRLHQLLWNRKFDNEVIMRLGTAESDFVKTKKV